MSNLAGSVEPYQTPHRGSLIRVFTFCYIFNFLDYSTVESLSLNFRMLKAK